MRALLRRAWALVKREPVRVWAGLISALLGLPALAGAPSWVFVLAGLAGTIIGAPIVRGSVTPTAAVEQAAAGLHSDLP